MYHRIKGSKLNFKVTDLLGVLSLLHPFYLYINHHFNVFFYLGLVLGCFFLTLNFFGITGFYVRADKNKIVLYEYFVPISIKIKTISEIEKNEKGIVLNLNIGRIVMIPFDKIDKKQRHKMNDLYYDVHNIIQRNTLKV